MCGIHAVISRDGAHSLTDDLRRCLINRGPDHVGEEKCNVICDDGTPISLTFTSTVLSLRGDHVTPQPLQDPSTGSVLCWNGEAWKLGGKLVEGNDSEAIFGLLAASSDEGAVLDVLRSISGPFAFVYFDARTSSIYFGRDRLGRRSLLINSHEGFVLSSISVSSPSSWSEVEADGIYVLDVKTWGCSAGSAPLTRKQWSLEHDDDFVLNIGRLNMSALDDVPPLLPAAPSVQQLHQQLVESLKLRVLNVPPPTTGEAANTRISILFSGGLDCTVLARLASDLLPPEQGIDLLNVAFENPRVAQHRNKDATGTIYEACPDRITGRKSFAELVSVCPSRKWRFVAVDVPYTETQAHRNQVISLMHPHNTEMDLSIAYALYFASRGIGSAYEHPDSSAVPYQTSARVLLSGLGADELFGGYSRHQAAFERAGYSGLVEELKLDVGRLGKRNLGRDDRAMAHWSREVRFPFLDEDFVKWAIETPVWEKCDFGNPGTGLFPEPAKRVLRLLAEDLGMPSLAREKKRAIQFGARTAKMESGRTKGTTLVTC